MSPILVLITGDHLLFLEGLRLLLGQQHDIQIVGEAADSLQAISMAEALQPDILLLDAQLPGLGSLEALSRIRKKSPETDVLILSGSPEDGLISDALQLGAKGYLSKSLGSKDVLRALRAIHAGEIWAERKVLAEMLEKLRKKTQEVDPSLPEMQVTLTERQREIVRWVIQGMTNKEIADRLGISDKTVKTHLSNIFSKLKISRRLQLVLNRIVEQQDQPQSFPASLH
ncbi:MAG TPA: response regulator transcription factor [Patescibacteria group bacterium]|nr:response regulator transcription factor [Patescibacteria group bacterium]